MTRDGFLPEATQRAHYQPWIDGLRGIAILLVVGYHAKVPGFDAGFVGVDIFFVVSGYLITGLLVAELERTGRIDLWAFYARRIRRLFPAFLVMLVSCVLVGWIVLSSIGDERRDLDASAVHALLITANHYFFANTGGYFHGAAELKPLLHTWSLSVEEQFYLAWPFAVALIGYLMPARRHLRALLIVAGLTWLASSLCCIAFSEYHQKATFFLAPARAWEISVGALAQLATVHRRPAFRAAGVACFVGLLALLWTLSQVGSATRWPGYVSQVLVLGTGLLVWGCSVDRSSVAQRVLSQAPLVWVGLLSYSWYLFHWPMLAFARVLRLGEADLVADVVLALAALVVAWVSYRLIENPIRRRRVLGQLSSRRVVLAAGAVTGVALASIGAFRVLGLEAPRTERELQLTTAHLDRSPAAELCQRPWYLPYELPSVERCTFPKPSEAQGKLVLWGDSHATQWLPMLLELAAANRYSVHVTTMDSCPPVRGHAPRTNSLEHDRNCVLFNEGVARRIADMSKSGELRGVVMAASWSGYGASSGSPLTREAIHHTLASIESGGARLLIIGPLPTMPHSVPICLFRKGGASCVLDRQVFEHQRRGVLAAIEQAIAAFPHARVWDPADRVCDDKRCRAEDPHVVFYFDWSHLTSTASRHLASSASPSVDWLVAGDTAAQTRSPGTTQFHMANSRPTAQSQDTNH